LARKVIDRLIHNEDNGLHVVRRVGKGKIDIPGETWVTVIDDGLATYYDIPYLMSPKQPARLALKSDFSDFRCDAPGLGL
jgi:hypothetical protein